MGRIVERMLILGVVLLVVASCYREPEDDIDKVVFIEDKNYPGLPIYSESGFDTFGAYINGKSWRSSAKEQFHLMAKHNSLFFTLYPDLKSRSESGFKDLKIIFTGFEIDKYDDILKLHKQEVDLSSSSCRLIFDLTDTVKNVTEGHLTFNRVKSVTVDKKFYEYVLSGTIAFSSGSGADTINMRHGRFDLSAERGGMFLISN